MMHTFRKVAVSLLFAILIVAFAIGMGGNYTFDRFRHATVAKVGSIEITPQQFDLAYQRVLSNLSARVGRAITRKQADALGLRESVLQGLIQDAALDQESQDLGLGLSPAGLNESIGSNKLFQDSSGKFSEAKFGQFLQRIGYSKPAFEQEFRKDLIRQQIQGMFAGSGVVPQALLDAFNRYLNEQRTISYFTLGASAAGEIPAPSDAVLQSFYDERKASFMVPELRKVAVLAVTPEPAPGKAAVPEDSVKAEYDANPASWGVPERRKIEIVPFQSKEAAGRAAAELADKKDFAGVVKSAGFSEADVTVGTVSKKELPEKFATNDAILNAAFGLKEGETSEPIDGPLSWVIVKVSGIVPGRQRSFDEVKDEIRESLEKKLGAEENAKQIAAFKEKREKLIKAFEEDRASGIQLQEFAKKQNLPLEEVTLDRNGNGQDGKPVQVSPVPAQTLAAAAFKSDIGVENEALQLPNGGFAWFDVMDIVKARQKPFEEVKANVEADWRKEQIRAKLAEKARDLVARLNRGEAIADVAKSAGTEVKTTPPLKRNASEPGLPPSTVAQAFSLGDNGASSTAGADGESRTVFQVTKAILPGPLPETEAKALTQRLSSQISEDNFAQYLTGVKKAAGVSVDPKSFGAETGASYDGEE